MDIVQLLYETFSNFLISFESKLRIFMRIRIHTFMNTIERLRPGQMFVYLLNITTSRYSTLKIICIFARYCIFVSLNFVIYT